MKAFIAEQDDIDIPPRLMMVHLKRQTAILVTSRGWPSLKQVRNAAKRIRRDQETKHSRKAVQDLVRLRCYRPNIKADSAFLFGATLDSDGYAYVGSGSDEDSFIIGITSLAMIDGCLRFSKTGLHSQFHAGATFKLSDIGYSVINCGFIDKSRAYQVGTFFVVSRRTAHEYAECFRSFAAIVREVCGVSLQVDAVMRDAEDAQYLGFELVSTFSGAKMLMSFFHVFSSVRKRVQHLPSKNRMLVMSSIVDMHFSKTSEGYKVYRDRELLKCRQTPQLEAFADYFQSQWLQGRYRCWQAYQNPSGYATTNNPCENLNGALKLFLQRRRHHMRRLLLKLCDFTETIFPLHPVKADYTPNTTTDIVQAAAALLKTSRVLFEITSDPDLMRVLQLNAESGSISDDDDEEEFRVTFDVDESSIEADSCPTTRPTSAMDLFHTLTSRGEPADATVSDEFDSSGTQDQLVENQGETNDEQDEECARCRTICINLLPNDHYGVRIALVCLPKAGW